MVWSWSRPLNYNQGEEPDRQVMDGVVPTTIESENQPRSRARATRIVFEGGCVQRVAATPLQALGRCSRSNALYSTGGSVRERGSLHFKKHWEGRRVLVGCMPCMWRYMMHASLLLSCLCLLKPVHRSHQFTTKDSSRYCLLLGNVVIVRIVVQVDFFGIRLDRAPADMVSVTSSEPSNP